MRTMRFAVDTRTQFTHTAHAVQAPYNVHRTRTQSNRHRQTQSDKREPSKLCSLCSPHEICGLAASLDKCNGTVRRIAMLVPFPGRLASETRPGLQNTVVREKWPTQESREQCCGPVARQPLLLFLVRKLNVMKNTHHGEFVQRELEQQYI